MAGGLGEGVYGLGIYGEIPGTDTLNPDAAPTTQPLLGGTIWEQAQRSGGIMPWTQVTVTVPGGEERVLTIDEDGACEVTHSLDQPRWQANVDVNPEYGTDVLDLVMTPAARFKIRVGWQSQGVVLDDIGMGVYELAQSPNTSPNEPIRLALQDLWKVLEETRFTTPRTIAAGSRILRIMELVQEVIPDVEFVMNTDGGTTSGFTVERERTEAIMQLANDGDMLVGFDGEGRFVFDPNPTKNPQIAVTLTNGKDANITELGFETKYERLYNAVTTVPQDGQTWVSKTFAIADPNHPRSPSKPGMSIRPYFVTVPGATTQAAADAAGRARLSAVVGTVDLATATTWARADLRAGMHMAILEEPTWATPGRSRQFLIDTVVHDCLQVVTQLTGRSGEEVPSEETA